MVSVQVRRGLINWAELKQSKPNKQTDPHQGQGTKRAAREISQKLTSQLPEVIPTHPSLADNKSHSVKRQRVGDHHSSDNNPPANAKAPPNTPTSETTPSNSPLHGSLVLTAQALENQELADSILSMLETQAKKENLPKKENSQGILVVSQGSGRLKHLETAALAKNLDINISKNTQHSTDKDNHHFYEITYQGKTFLVSEVVLPEETNEKTAADTLSQAYIRHAGTSDNCLPQVIGAKWEGQTPPEPIQSQNPLDCAFAAVGNFLLAINNPKTPEAPTLTAQDYAKYLNKPDRTLKAGILSDKVLNAMQKGKKCTLTKQEFTDSLADESTRGLYHVTINNNNAKCPNAEELWSQLAKLYNPEITNTSAIEDITLTPALWHAAKGAISPQSLANLLNEQENLKFLNTHWITTTFPAQNQESNFEQDLINVFCQPNNQNSEIPKNPAFIALVGDDGNGVSNHFVTLTLLNGRWFTLDSQNKETTFACEQSELLAYLQKNNRQNIVHLNTVQGT